MARRVGLKRAAGLTQVVAYGVGNIIGAGIYVLIGAASGLAGGAIWLAFLVGAVIALFTGLSYAELSALYPKAASEYIYVGRAYGNRLLSFLSEWVMLITEIVAATAVSLGFAEYFQTIVAIPVQLVAAFLLLLLTAINIMGIRQSLKLNTILSGVAVAGLLIVIIAGLPKLGTANYTFSPNGTAGIFGAAILVFFAYIGFDNIANLAEETENPRKTLPRGLLISVAITTVLYVLVGLTSISLVPYQQLSASNAPLATAASAALGPVAFDILTFAALATTFNTVLVILIAASRVTYGMGREGALPKVLGKVNKRQAPYVASIAALLIALAFLPLGKVDLVARITSFGSLLVFALVNLALLHLRRVAPKLKRPFKAPLNIGWVSVTGVFGVVSCLALLTQFDLASLLLGLVLPFSGMAVYILYNKGLPPSASARLHQKHEKR